MLHTPHRQSPNARSTIPSGLCDSRRDYVHNWVFVASTFRSPCEANSDVTATSRKKRKYPMSHCKSHWQNEVNTRGERWMWSTQGEKLDMVARSNRMGLHGTFELGSTWIKHIPQTPGTNYSIIPLHSLVLLLCAS